MSNKKKVIIMSSLVLLLAATAVFNFVFANENSMQASGDGVTTANYFTTYRAERTTTRNEELVQLDSVIALYEAGDDKYVIDAEACVDCGACAGVCPVDAPKQN